MKVTFGGSNSSLTPKRRRPPEPRNPRSSTIVPRGLCNPKRTRTQSPTLKTGRSDGFSLRELVAICSASSPGGDSRSLSTSLALFQSLCPRERGCADDAGVVLQRGGGAADAGGDVGQGPAVGGLPNPLQGHQA